MLAKLHINISQGILDIEGDPDLVREVYRELKDQLLNGVPSFGGPQPLEHAATIVQEASSGTKPKVKRRPSSRKKTESDSGSSGINTDTPKLDKHLDTSQLELFYNQFEPKNNSEKILIFLKFLTEELEIEHPNTDQVFTCFKRTGEKIPRAFAQAFYDTSSKHGYIDFRTPTDISVTIAGDNHFNLKLKKKSSE